MTADLHALHPEHLTAGLIVAVLALAAARWRPHDRWDVAAIGTASWLAFDQQLPPLAVAAVGLVAASGRLTGRGRAGALAAAAGAIVLGRPHATGVVVLAVVATALVVACARDGDTTPPRILGAGLVGAAMAATATGGPDTEGAIALAAAALPVLLVGPSHRRGETAAAPGPRSWGLLALAALVAADAYRGRPAGLTAAAVAAAALVVASAAARLGTRTGRHGWTPARSLACVAASSLLAIGAARTIGLDQQATTWSVAASLASCCLVVAAGLVSAPRGSARTPGA